MQPRGVAVATGVEVEDKDEEDDEDNDAGDANEVDEEVGKEEVIVSVVEEDGEQYEGLLCFQNTKLRKG